jgi:HEAT repeat protein
VELLKQMMADQRPAFRATAAYLAGQMATPEAKALLSRARKDDEASVRLAAKQSMVQIRRAARLDAEGRVAQPAAAAGDSAAKPQRTARTVAVVPKKKTAERRIRVRLDGSSTATRWD